MNKNRFSIQPKCSTWNTKKRTSTVVQTTSSTNHSDKTVSSRWGLFERVGILFVLFFSSCAYGPETKEKSLLESLNGKHYENGGNGAGGTSTPALPIVKRRRAAVRLSGTILLKLNPIPVPLGNQKIILLQNEKVLATTLSEVGGVFTFMGDFPDGPVKLYLDSRRYRGEQQVLIHGFELNNIDFFVEDKNTLDPSDNHG